MKTITDKCANDFKEKPKVFRGVEAIVSISDVAREAGTSVASVSRVLNGVPVVSAGVVERVKQAASNLKYHPDHHGRSLRSGRRFNIGILVSQGALFDKPYSEWFSSELTTAITAEGYGVSMEFLPWLLKDTVFSTPNMVKERRCDGLMIIGHLSKDALAEISSWGIPVCLINNKYDDPEFVSVCLDDYAGAHDAVQFLAAQRHRRIGFIHGTLKWPSTYIRHQGYMDTMKELGLPLNPEYIVQVAEDQQNYKGGYAGTLKLLHDAPDLDAIFYINDWYAVGGLCAAKEMGRSVPGDLSLMGFDGSWFAKETTPILTSMSMEVKSISQRAAEMLVRAIEGRTLVEPNMMIRPNLVRGESTAPIIGVTSEK